MTAEPLPRGRASDGLLQGFAGDAATEALALAAAVPFLFLHATYQPTLSIGLGTTSVDVTLADVAIALVVCAAVVRGRRDGWAPLRAARVVVGLAAADMAILASCANMVKPGESNRLILALCHSTEAMAVEMVIWREISSSSWSVTVEPSSTRPSLGVAPPVYNIAETREVLPECECPMTTRLRMSLPS